MSAVANQADDPKPTALMAEGISKSYTIDDGGVQRLQMLRGKRHRGTEYQALTNVSLTVRQGETVGIVGRNGAGKSTLLKVLAGITEPDAGRVTSNGQLMPVIGPAAGMKSDLSGRDNIEIRASMLGVSSEELSSRLDEIAEFAELGDYIDRPLRMYSAGMKARLGFAVNFAFQPDILLVDETLAGGDNAFRRKVLARVSEIQANGATVVLVSHAPNMIVQFCDRAILIEGGEKLADATPKAIVDAYQKLLSAGEDQYQEMINEIRTAGEADPSPAPASGKTARASEKSANAHPAQRTSAARELVGFTEPATRWQSVWVTGRINDVAIESPTGRADGDAFRVYRCTLKVKVEQPVRNLTGRVLIKTAEGIEFATLDLNLVSNAATDAAAETLPEGHYELAGEFTNRLLPARYTIDVAIAGVSGNTELTLHQIKDALAFECVGGGGEGVGIVDLGLETSRATTNAARDQLRQQPTGAAASTNQADITPAQ
jgi:lipopolysaccharide transport system ATP-binding protein